MDLEIILGGLPSTNITSICFNLASSVGLLRMRCMLLVTVTKVQIFPSVGFDFSGSDRRCAGSEFPARQAVGSSVLQTGGELVIAWSTAC